MTEGIEVCCASLVAFNVPDKYLSIPICAPVLEYQLKVLQNRCGVPDLPFQQAIPSVCIICSRDHRGRR